MPRFQREIYNGAVLHIVLRGNNKKRTFYRKKEFTYFENLVMKYKRKCELAIYHYCIMSNHVHFLLQIKTPELTAKALQGIQLSYYHFYRRRVSFAGHLWQGRFYSKCIEDFSYLIRAGLYIERNPCKAGIVRKPEEYLWGSYSYYAFGKPNRLITPNPYYIELGKNPKERQTTYRKLMKDYSEETMEINFESM